MGSQRELYGDIVVVGGGLGGCAAALAALRNGMRVLLTEETDWLGGQLTSQAVPPDENPWIEKYGCTRAYRQFREKVRDHYRRNFPLTDEARNRADLNPGNGFVSRICHEPRAALAVLEELLAPYRSNGALTVLLRHKPVMAECDGDRVLCVGLRDRESGTERIVSGKYFVDATELGDLLPLTRAEYVTGAESRSETDEAHAPVEAQPHNMQAFTCCFAMDYLDGEDHTIQRPAEYDFWRSYVPQLDPPWTGRLLDFSCTHPYTMEPRTLAFNPTGKDPQSGYLWWYRNIADPHNFQPGFYRSGICLVNWPQNDYLLGNLCEVPDSETERHIAGGKQLSLSLLYWLQTEAPRPDGQTGWPGLRLRRDVVGTEDGLAKHPYVRESRRIRALFTVTENHIGLEARMRITGLDEKEVRAESFSDSVGIGYYRIDLHPSTGGDNYIDIPSLPFQIPMGALIPRRVVNLLAGCKNLGVTHISNGCYRLHPIEWNIGEAAGALAAFSIQHDIAPAGVHASSSRLIEFQALLAAQGVELAWPDPA